MSDLLFGFLEKYIVHLIVVAVILLIIGIIGHGVETIRLMKECMADGNPEYKCAGMIGDRRIQPAPVILIGR